MSLNTTLSRINKSFYENPRSRLVKEGFVKSSKNSNSYSIGDDFSLVRFNISNNNIEIRISIFKDFFSFAIFSPTCSFKEFVSISLAPAAFGIIQNYAPLYNQDGPFQIERSGSTASSFTGLLGGDIVGYEISYRGNNNSNQELAREIGNVGDNYFNSHGYCVRDNVLVIFAIFIASTLLLGCCCYNRRSVVRLVKFCFNSLMSGSYRLFCISGEVREGLNGAANRSDYSSIAEQPADIPEIGGGTGLQPLQIEDRV